MKKTFGEQVGEFIDVTVSLWTAGMGVLITAASIVHLFKNQ